MSYEVVGWQNEPSTATALSAENLNHMDQGIYDAHQGLNELQGLAYGPLKAATVADMTDQTRVYVYTGSESGYVAGNWYYYNGSAWVSGGVYNAVAVSTDKTLSISDKAADAKAVGDIFTKALTYKGDLAENADLNSYMTTGIYRNTFTSQPTNAPIGGRFALMVISVNNSSLRYISQIVVRKTQTNQVFYLRTYDTSFGGWSDWVNLIDTPIDDTTVKIGVSRVNTTITDGKYTQNLSDLRVSSEEFLCIATGYLKIKAAYSSAYSFHVVYYDNDHSTIHGGSVTTYTEYKLEVGNYYTIVLRKTDGTEIDPNDFYTVFEENYNFYSDYILTHQLKARSKPTAIYGIEFKNIKSSIKIVNRILDAVGLENDYYDESASSYANGGHNDFDDIYPWSDIKRCNVTMVNGKPKVTWEGEAAYKDDGTNGNIMVYIPEFFYGRRINEATNTEQWMISATQYAGFTKFPATFFAAYQGSESNSGVFSASGKTPQTRHFLLNGSAEFPGSFYDDYAEYNMRPFDFMTRIALQYLISIEFCSINLGKTHNIGGFEGIPYGWSNGTIETRLTAKDTASNTNQIRLRCYDDAHDWEYYESNGIADAVQKNSGHFCVGDTVAVLQADEYQEIAPRKILSITYESSGVSTPPYYAIFTLDGDPFDTIADSTILCGNPQETGGTDNVYAIYHTGIAHRSNVCPGSNVSAWNEHFRRFVYRGIEDPWGNVYNNICGIGNDSNHFKYTFDDTKYRPVDFSEWEDVPWDVPDVGDFNETVNGKPYWIYKMGFDAENPTLLLARLCNGHLGDPDYYKITGADLFGDTFKIYSGNHFCAEAGGGWDHTFRGGMFMMRFSSGTYQGKPYWVDGCRPLYHVKTKANKIY